MLLLAGEVISAVIGVLIISAIGFVIFDSVVFVGMILMIAFLVSWLIF